MTLILLVYICRENLFFWVRQYLKKSQVVWKITLVAQIAPKGIQSLKKLSKMRKGQSINYVIQRKIMQSTKLTELCARLAFPKQATSNVVANLNKVVF